MTKAAGRGGKGGTDGRAWKRLRERVKRHQDTCWICGEPINFDADYPAPDSFTVDHVEPVAMRPELARTYSNLRAAHAGCNRARGQGDGPTELTTSRPW